MIELAKYPKFKENALLQKKIHFLETSWRIAYPNVNLESQLGWAYAWIESNPSKAPKKDLARFLNNWMRNAEKWAASPIKPPKQPTYKEIKPNEEEIMTAEDFREMRERI